MWSEHLVSYADPAVLHASPTFSLQHIRAMQSALQEHHGVLPCDDLSASKLLIEHHHAAWVVRLGPARAGWVADAQPG